MKKLFALAALTCLSLQLSAAEQKIGIVNFGSCVTDSKLGKQEQNALETMRKQIMSLMEDKDKQLRELAEKRKDKDHLDGLSAEAIEQMDLKIAELSEDLGRSQQQYYQFLHQGQNKIMQAVAGGINHAADQIAAAEGYTLILNKEACFSYPHKLDITSQVIKEMDKKLDIEEKKVATVEETKETAAVAPAN